MILFRDIVPYGAKSFQNAGQDDWVKPISLSDIFCYVMKDAY